MRAARVPDEATVAQRRAAYRGHWPRTAGRVSVVPSALADAPEFLALDAERQAIREAQMAVNRQHDDWQRRVELARSEHVAEAKAAMEAGDPLPAPFVPEQWAGLEHEGEFWDAKYASVEACEVALLVDRADEWKRRLGIDDAQAAVVAAEERLKAAQAHLRPLVTAAAAIDRFAGVDDVAGRREVSRGMSALSVRSSHEAVDAKAAFDEYRQGPPNPLRGRR